MPVVLALLVVFATACQSGDAAPRPRKTSLPRVGAKVYAPITIDEAHPLLFVPPNSRILQPPTKLPHVERVIAAYCIDDATLDTAQTAIRAELAAAGWTDLEVREQDDSEGPFYLLAGKHRDLSASVEVMQTSVQPDCNADGQVAVGIAVYRVRS